MSERAGNCRYREVLLGDPEDVRVREQFRQGGSVDDLQGDAVLARRPGCQLVPTADRHVRLAEYEHGLGRLAACDSGNVLLDFCFKASLLKRAREDNRQLMLHGHERTRQLAPQV